ncbi:NAD-dependent dehydratase [Sinomonas atrocyanea]|uniref:NAD-dependent dehydratase n=1 Tax=Sinomonas atrocyanea TaxID=37927 RepID=A0A127A4N0_9MICC|nr:hypothetical protein [Sinomonas atrocyanea]AMM34448.1 NAD-dependent dehydratase [Sinomonas atrocyanea]GEB65828.1 hypothetical protein SAT01_32760 [Sinomonas atrocyanea]GGG61140.1 hypothetical protein GCM10007172_10210 [Sinomonas atrocyanea]
MTKPSTAMAQPTVRNGAVAWTGDNPFIYLKRDPQEPWNSLSLYFRIASSPYGSGRAAIVVENPYQAEDPSACRLVLTDNAEMARFLVREFVSRFLLFRPSPVMDQLEYVDGARFEETLDGDDWTEQASAGGRSIALTWRGLGEPFAVDVPGPESGTGAHEMFAVFRIAQAGEVTVDGRRLPGSTVERDFLNGRGQSAGFAMSETWVEDL